MAQYRKKPVVIEAVQYLNAPNESPIEGMIYPPPIGFIDYSRHEDEKMHKFGIVSGPHIMTIEGPLHCSPEDWIITGIKGEKYPCKPDIFEATYEKVEP